MKLEISRQTLEKILISNSMKIRPSVADLFYVERETDERTDMMKLIIASSTSANSPDVQSLKALVTSNIIQSVCLVGKGRLKERCGLEPRTDYFSFKKSAKTSAD